MNEKWHPNEMSTAELIYKFFDFYINKFPPDQMINISEGGFSKKDSKDNYACSIVDPFQIEHNPGQTPKLNCMSHRIMISKIEDVLAKVKKGQMIFS